MSDKTNGNQRPEAPDPDQLYPIERFYERFRGIPLRRLDIFIGICIAALIIVVAVGIMDARGVF